MNNLFQLSETLNVNVTVEKMLFSLGITALLTIYIMVVYKATYKGAVYTHSFSVSMVLSSMTTCLIILPISSNLALSIGTGGVLSMVRYRTAVKDPRDISFMFWAIGVGLICGIGYQLVAIAASAFIGIILVILSLVTNIGAVKEPCIAVIKLAPGADVGIINNHLKCNVKSLIVTDTYQELTAELKNIPNPEVVSALKAEEQILGMSFVKYNGDYAL